MPISHKIYKGDCLNIQLANIYKTSRFDIIHLFYVNQNNMNFSPNLALINDDFIINMGISAVYILTLTYCC